MTQARGNETSIIIVLWLSIMVYYEVRQLQLQFTRYGYAWERWQCFINSNLWKWRDNNRHHKKPGCHNTREWWWLWHGKLDKSKCVAFKVNSNTFKAKTNTFKVTRYILKVKTYTVFKWRWTKWSLKWRETCSNQKFCFKFTRYTFKVLRYTSKVMRYTFELRIGLLFRKQRLLLQRISPPRVKHGVKHGGNTSMSRCKRNTSRRCPEHSKLHFWFGNGYVKIILTWS